MASVPPNTTVSGGISPSGWTRELTEFEMLIVVQASGGTGVSVAVHTKNQTAAGEYTYSFRLVYLIDEKQLTKDRRGLRRVLGGLQTCHGTRERHEKRFSHKRSVFPSRRLGRQARFEQRTGKFEGYQVVALMVLHAQYLGAKVARNTWEGSHGGQWSAWDFKQDLRRRPESATHGDQHAARGNVQGRGKLQEFFILFIPTSNEDRDRQGQARPPPTFSYWSRPRHAHPFPRSNRTFEAH